MEVLGKGHVCAQFEGRRGGLGDTEAGRQAGRQQG